MLFYDGLPKSPHNASCNNDHTFAYFVNWLQCFSSARVTPSARQLTAWLHISQAMMLIYSHLESYLSENRFLSHQALSSTRTRPNTMSTKINTTMSSHSSRIVEADTHHPPTGPGPVEPARTQLATLAFTMFSTHDDAERIRIAHESYTPDVLCYFGTDVFRGLDAVINWAKAFSTGEPFQIKPTATNELNDIVAAEFELTWTKSGQVLTGLDVNVFDEGQGKFREVWTMFNMPVGGEETHTVHLGHLQLELFRVHDAKERVRIAEELYTKDVVFYSAQKTYHGQKDMLDLAKEVVEGEPVEFAATAVSECHGCVVVHWWIKWVKSGKKVTGLDIDMFEGEGEKAKIGKVWTIFKS